MNKFPLPVSKNSHINGVTLRSDGLFLGYTIVWAGEFLPNKEQTPKEENVFILQHMERKDFLFCFWVSSESQPSILLQKHYDNCFYKNKSKSPSNRYLFAVNGKWFLLPYAPKDLFDEWTSNLSYSTVNNAGISFFSSLFENHLKKYCEENVELSPKKRFCGWFSSYKAVPIDAYRKLFVQCTTEKTGALVDVSRHPKELSEKDLAKVKDAFLIVRTIFHNIIQDDT